MAANLSKGSAPSRGADPAESANCGTSTTRLTLVRHAPSEATRRSAFPLDEPLDPARLDEARALAARLDRVDAVWSSPAARARQTARGARARPRRSAAGARRVRLRRLARAHAGRAAQPRTRPPSPPGWRTLPRRRTAASRCSPLLERVRGWLETRAGDGGRTVAGDPRGRHPRGRGVRVGCAGRMRSGASTWRRCRARCCTRMRAVDGAGRERCRRRRPLRGAKLHHRGG